jgi:hypothetical protein
MPQQIIRDDRYDEFVVHGSAYRAAITVTRPSNLTAYTAGDVIGAADTITPANAGSAVITLPSMGPAGGIVFVQSVQLLIAQSSIPSGMAGFRLHFYTASPTAILDNAVFDLTSPEAASYAGYVDLSTPQDLGSTLFTQADYCGTAIKLATGTNALYAELETRSAYTPASGTAHSLRVVTLEAGL